MPLGPLTLVDTLMDGVGADIDRLMRLPPGSVLHLVRVDEEGDGGWAVVQTLTRGWTRVGTTERAKGEGYTVHFQITDLYAAGELLGWLEADEAHATHLMVSTEGVYYQIDTIPKVSMDVGQTYDVYCVTDTLVRASE